MANAISMKLVRRALHVCGGMRPLCARLGVRDDEVEAWLDGLPMPRPVLLKAVDLVLDDHEAWMAQDRRAEARPFDIREAKKTTPQGGQRHSPKEKLGQRIFPLHAGAVYRRRAETEVAKSATPGTDCDSN